MIIMASDKKSGKPRLLVATDCFLPRWDGVARFLKEVLPGLQEDFDVVVVSPDYGPVENEGYHHVRIPLQRRVFGDFRPARFRYWRVRREVRRADVVFSQTIGPVGAAAILAARAAGRPLACYIHSLESQLVPRAMGPSPLRKILYPFMRWYTRFLYNRASLLLTPSEWVDEQLSWDGITSPKRVVRLGVDTGRFSPDSAKTIRKRLGFSDDDVVIGQHGRLAREKDLKTLLRAFIRLRRKRENVKLLVVGDGLSELKRLLSRQEGVVLPGKQDNIVPYLRAMDVFALTSMTETTSLSTLEAMSCGLPVVSTPVGFVKDYIEEGENGFFIPFRDSNALRERLEWLVDHPTLRERIGKAGREMVVEHFSWGRTVKGIRESLKGLLPGQDR